MHACVQQYISSTHHLVDLLSSFNVMSERITTTSSLAGNVNTIPPNEGNSSSFFRENYKGSFKGTGGGICVSIVSCNENMGIRIGSVYLLSLLNLMKIKISSTDIK